jgi:hypothetical protein
LLKNIFAAQLDWLMSRFAETISSANCGWATIRYEYKNKAVTVEKWGDPLENRLLFVLHAAIELYERSAADRLNDFFAFTDVGTQLIELINHGRADQELLATLLLELNARNIKVGEKEGDLLQSAKEFLKEEPYSVNHFAAIAKFATEPPRDSRRLQFLRGWSHENNNEIFAGVP